jgi:hypothetical protein
MNYQPTPIISDLMAGVIPVVQLQNLNRASSRRVGSRKVRPPPPAVQGQGIDSFPQSTAAIFLSLFGAWFPQE